MSVFSCPVCGERLERSAKNYSCSRGHLYDVSSAGYVNLLLSNQKHSANPGDDRNMMRARAGFLQKGYFRLLRDELARVCLRYAPDRGVALDSGCGEGYYAAGVRQAFGDCGREVRTAGIDIAKYGVQLAAKKDRAVEWAVASAYNLPLADASVDVLWSCFSPVALDEFHRVTKLGGIVALVQPSARHLWGVKSVLYDEPYENPPNFYEHPGFHAVDRYEAGAVVRIEGTEDILNLFRMTPYYWKTSVEGGEKLARSTEIETEIGFIFDILERR